MLINIVGGLFIGMIQHGLSFGNAIEIYTILTIGDGLVAQIPSLLLSVATAIIVTRENETQEMGKEIRGQLGNNQALYIAAGVLFVMGIIPGMPHIAFLGFSFLIAGFAYWQSVQAKKKAAEPKVPDNVVKDESVAPEVKELGWDDVCLLYTSPSPRD